MSNLSQIKADSNWGDASNTINTNFQNMDVEVEKLKNSTTRFKGYFTNETNLKNKFPSPKRGDIAFVGEPYPGNVYDVLTDGSWHNTTKAPETGSVDLQDYVTKDDFEASQKEQDDKLTELDASQKEQDDKLTELKEKIDETIEFKEDYTNDFSIEDDENNTIVSFKNGHIRTENFDSSKVELEIDDNNNDDFSIEDEKGNTIVSFKNGHIKTENFDSQKIGGSSGLSFDNGYMSLPYDVPRVYINSELLTVVKGSDGKPTNEIKPLNTSKNEVGDLELQDVKLTFKSNCLNFEDFIVISYQGQSSLSRPKKGFSIDLKEKHRIGKWLEFDSFHLKGYHSDWIHIRDILNAQIYEQMMLKRDIGKNRPYQVYNSLLSAGSYEGLVNSNAMCHIDGFPIELYINDEYWGLYSWNIKKDRSNYCLNKKNANHIMIDAASLTTSTLNWAGLEVRAPKDDNLVDINGNEYNGDYPKELMGEDSPLYSGENEKHVLSAQVKKRIQDFWTKTRQLQSIDDVKSILNIYEFIDCYLLYDFVNDWDIWSRNTLYTTYDGTHFSPLYYDGDGSWGIGMTKEGGGFVDGDVILSSSYDPFVNYAEYNRDLSWVRNIATILSDNIKKRYSELRSCGIFSVENVTILCDRWTKWIGLDIYEKDGERWSYAGFGGSEQNFYDSTKRMKEWISERIVYLDTKYNF